MRKLLVTATAASFALALPLGVAVAQDAAPAPKPEDSINERVVPENNEVTFEEVENADSNFRVALEAMGNLKTSTEALGGISLSKVSVVPVEEVVDPADADGKTLSAMSEEHKADIDAMRTAIGANAGLKQLLDAHDVKLENVLAIDVNEDGVVTLYVQKLT